MCPNPGWSRWLELLSNSNSYTVLFPGFLLCFIVSFKPSIIKGTYRRVVVLPTRKLAKSKQQVTDRKIPWNGMFYLPGSKPIRFSGLLREKNNPITRKSTRNKPLSKQIAALYFSSFFDKVFFLIGSCKKLLDSQQKKENLNIS